MAVKCDLHQFTLNCDSAILLWDIELNRGTTDVSGWYFLRVSTNRHSIAKPQVGSFDCNGQLIAMVVKFNCSYRGLEDAEISGGAFYSGKRNGVVGRLLKVTSEDLLAVFGHGVL